MSKQPPQPGFIPPPKDQQQPQYPPPTAPAPAPAPAYPGHPPQPKQQPPAVYHPQPFPAPIQHQPGFGGYQQQTWAANPNFRDYLRGASSFHVKQKVELVEALVGFETGNKYSIKDQAGNKIFYAAEESSCLWRNLWQAGRPFTLVVRDRTGQNVLMFDRPCNCVCCFGCLCPDSLSVSTPSGEKLGSVHENCGIIYPSYTLKDASGKAVFRVIGPWLPMSCGGAVTFRVENVSGATVGTISKEWSGWMQELFTDADYFSISFPVDLDPSMKAVCLGCLFLIDYQYFEGDGKKGQGRRLFG